MADPICRSIGRPSDFDDPRFIARLARAAGDKDVLETCDVVRRYGEAVLGEETIVGLFRDPQGAAFPARTIRERGLRLYREYPKTRDLEAYAAELKRTADPSVDGIVAIDRFLGRYYARVKRAHEVSKMPYADEETAVLDAVMSVGNRNELGAVVLQWACTSADFPNPLFERFIEGGYRHFMGNRSGGERLVGAMLLQQCYDAAPSERQASMRQIFQRVGEELSSPVPLGKPFPVEAVVSIAKGKKVSLVYLWSPGCPHCLDAMGGLREIDRKLERFGGGVIGVHLNDEEDAVGRAIERYEGRWTDVGVSGEEFRTISQDGSVPAFAIVDAEGDVVYSRLGFDREAIEEALRKTFPTYGAQEL